VASLQGRIQAQRDCQDLRDQGYDRSGNAGHLHQKVNGMRTCEVTDCDNLVEGNTSRCGHHNRLARKISTDRKKEAERAFLAFEKQQIKNSEPRPTIAKVSDKRKVLNAEYSILAEQFKRDNPECKAKIENVCTKATEDVHHQKGRIGDLLMDEDYFLPVCRACHSWIELHPTLAQKRGLSFLRLTI